jgi:hypothetical protein
VEGRPHRAVCGTRKCVVPRPGRVVRLSGDCNPAETIGTYWRKHNPLVSFDSVRNNATRCAKAVNSAQLDTDLAGASLLP